VNGRPNYQKKLKLVHRSPDVTLESQAPNLVQRLEGEEARETHLDVVVLVVKVFPRPAVVLEVNGSSDHAVGHQGDHDEDVEAGRVKYLDEDLGRVALRDAVFYGYHLPRAPVAS
jgi:hypothetical protein